MSSEAAHAFASLSSRYRYPGGSHASWTDVVLRKPEGSKEFATGLYTKFQVVDLAASEKETADYTVMTEIWVTPENDMLVSSVVRDRVPVPDQPAFFKEHHAGGPVNFEVIGYQTGIVQTMLRQGFPATPVYPDKDKVTRAGVAGALYRGGKVYHRAGAAWLVDFEAELLAFQARSLRLPPTPRRHRGLIKAPKGSLALNGATALGQSGSGDASAR
jgi:phage terminase large subunit-like protein